MNWRCFTQEKKLNAPLTPPLRQESLEIKILLNTEQALALTRLRQARGSARLRRQCKQPPRIRVEFGFSGFLSVQATGTDGHDQPVSPLPTNTAITTAKITRYTAQTA